MASIHIIGRLTRDPEYTPANGNRSQRVNFTIAEDNEHGDNASFFPCVAFGKSADVIDKWTYKGKLVYVKGSMEQGEPYTDKNGNKQRSWSVWVERCKFLDSAKKDNGQAASKLEQDAAALLMPDTMEAQEEDIPF